MVGEKMATLFVDRIEAAGKLAAQLKRLSLTDPLILAIPRGGVVVGYWVAKAIGAEMDIVVPRKLGAPGQPELAIGAVMHDGSLFLNEDIMAMGWVPKNYIEEEKQKQITESNRRLRVYRGTRVYPKIMGRVVVIIDDGIATGATMIAALRWARTHGAKRVVAAVPVAPPEMMPRLRVEADEIACVRTPEPFFAIGQFFQNFESVEDNEVIELLKKAWRTDDSSAQ